VSTVESKNSTPLSEEKVEKTVNDMYDRYDTLSKKLPVQLSNNTIVITRESESKIRQSM